MSVPVRVEAEASAELEKAAQWYEAQHAGLGHEFLAAVDQAVARITKWPDAGAPLGDLTEDLPVRRIPVPRFPYHIAYLMTREAIRLRARPPPTSLLAAAHRAIARRRARGQSLDALELYETGVGNRRGNLPGALDRDRHVAATMQDQDRGVRSDAPVPRLWKVEHRANVPRRSSIVRYSGRSHISSMFCASGGMATIVAGPAPHA